MMVRHHPLLSLISQIAGGSYINSFYIGEDEQALEKGTVKAKICNTVVEEIYVSENGTFNLTRKRREGFQEQTPFHAKGTTLAGA